ncbi:MAG: class I SAM-dependent methyltransferase [Pseudomonadota bacterium]|nr:class I SAM-dependent methyltransferase [Pseudomonadota bacterium]
MGETYLIDGSRLDANRARALFSGSRLEDRQVRCLNLLEGQRIVEIGSYSGHFVAEAVRRLPGSEVIGTDYFPDHIRLARLLHPEIADQFRQMSVYQLDLPDASVDCVVMQEVIEHLEGAALAVKEVNRVLKPGGVFIVTTPHPYYWRDLAAFFVRESANRLRRQRQLKTAIYFDDVEWNRHIYCWTPSTLLTLMVTNGFAYVDHDFSTDARGWLESALLRVFPVLGPTQIVKVRKTGESRKDMV